MSFPRCEGTVFDVWEPTAGECRDRAHRAPLGRLLMLRLLAVLASVHWAGPALAQRADVNVVTAAEDAFGTSVGSSTIGLYSPTDARGFNPRQAGNLRIEGLYFDYEGFGGDFDSCLVRESTMRIGIAAQSYSFPSPTGIADLKLNTPGDQTVVSTNLSRGPFNGASALLEAQVPLSPQLSGGVCVAYNEGLAADVVSRSHMMSLASVWRWRPGERTEVVPFWIYSPGGARRILPAVYSDAVEPPPLFDQRRLATQAFTAWDWHQHTLGVLLRHAFGRGWGLTAGLFRFHEHDPLSFNEEYLSVLPNRTTDHVLDVVPPLTAAATSGELRLARRFLSGAHERKLEFALRGRSVDRTFGGDTLIDYGIVALESGPPPPPTTAFSTSPGSVDETRQLDAGIVFEDRVKGVGSFGIGALKDQYRRTVIAPTAAPQVSSAAPWLLNVRFTAETYATATLYGSYTQGLEDSALAPSSAANRGEPPPATRTHQVDGGIRYEPSKELTLIVGAFEIHKVYFNLDTGNVYTALGTIRHRGLETSLTYGSDGLTLVAGGVWLRPHVEHTMADPAATGSVPLGPVPLELKLNIDYAPPRWGPWSAAAQWNWQSTRVATADDRYRLPAFSTLGAGLRYSSKLGPHPWSLRLDGMNLTNATALHLSGVGLVMPELGRRVQLTFAMDT